MHTVCITEGSECLLIATAQAELVEEEVDDEEEVEAEAQAAGFMYSEKPQKNRGSAGKRGI